MSLSTTDQIQNSYDFLSQMEMPECPGCTRGIRMCYHTPCIGTVEDFERLLDAGYAKNLMLDWWTGEETKTKTAQKIAGTTKPIRFSKKSDNPFEEDVWYLSPAIIGIEGKKAPWNKTGICNLLVDNQCSLHSKGLKPTQGKMACCKIENKYMEGGKEVELDERHMVLHTWNSERGKALIERWKKEVNYTGTQVTEIPSDLPGMLKSLTSMMGSHSNMSSNNVNDGRPPIDPNEKFDKTEIIYDIPVIP